MSTTTSLATESDGPQAPQQELLAESFGERLTDLDHDLWELFVRTADAHPQHEAIVSLWQPTSPVSNQHASTRRDDTSSGQDLIPLRWSYWELRTRSQELATWLQGQGHSPRTKLATVVWNSAEWALCFWTAARLGMVFVPLDPRLMPTDGEYLLDAIDPAILVVQDSEEEASMQLHVPVALARIRTRISFSREPGEGWSSLPERTGESDDDIPQTPSSASKDTTRTSIDPDSPAVIVFTSGTTSTPKGCVHTARNIWAQTWEYDPETAGQFERWLVHTPNSHLFALQHALRAWRKGDTVVFPAPKFDVQASAQALIREQCTYMAAVPAIIKAILAQPDFPGKEALSLRYATLGSTLIGESDVRLCRDELGAENAIQAFGMSEGSPIASWMRRDPLLKHGYHHGVGKVLPGANMRICAPGSRLSLARNVLGELHAGGAVVISGYLDGSLPEKFYSDEAGNWVVTGDQGLIDENGILHITGRYNDIIVRGGKNIAPVKIEHALSQIPGLHSQVIGVPDQFAGEVPVAIVSLPEGCIEPEETKLEVLDRAQGLGPQYALGHVYTLHELGLEAFPATVTGKIRKSELRQTVVLRRQFAANPDGGLSRATHSPLGPSSSLDNWSPGASDGSEGGSSSNDDVIPENDTSDDEMDSEKEPAPSQPTPGLTEELLSVWEDLVGFRPSAKEKFESFADSLTFLRYCDRYLIRFNRRVYLSDLTNYPTVETLAASLQARGNGHPRHLQVGKVRLSTQNSDAFLSEKHGLSRSNPVLSTLQQGLCITQDSGQQHFVMAHVHDPENDPIVKDMVEIMPLFQSLGVQSKHVESVFKVGECFQPKIISRERPQSYRHRIGFKLQPLPSVPLGPEKVREALEMVFRNHPILRAALLKHNGEWHYYIIAALPKLLDGMITQTALDTILDANLRWGEDFQTWDSVLLTTQARIFTIRSTGEIRLDLEYHHSVFDMISISRIHAELDHLLSTPDLSQIPNPEPTPTGPTLFQCFIELCDNFETSKSGKESVDFHVQRLHGISRFPHALWPEVHAPGRYIGNDEDTVYAEKREDIRKRRWEAAGTPWKKSDPENQPLARSHRLVGLTDMKEIRRQSKNLQSIVKAALAVFNVRKTGEPFAVFNTVEAARHWPFVPPWMANYLPPAESIDGPTVEWVLHMTKVDLSGRKMQETVAGLIDRVDAEQREAARHSHASIGAVMKGLSDADAMSVYDAKSRQTFVWDVTLRFVGPQADKGAKDMLEDLPDHGNCKAKDEPEGEPQDDETQEDESKNKNRVIVAETDVGESSKSAKTTKKNKSKKSKSNKKKSPTIAPIPRVEGYQVLKGMDRLDWPDGAIYWNCCMISEENLQIVASWDTAQMTPPEIKDALDLFAACIEKIATPSNWNKQLHEVFE